MKMVHPGVAREWPHIENRVHSNRRIGDQGKECFVAVATRTGFSISSKCFLQCATRCSYKVVLELRNVNDATIVEHMYVTYGNSASKLFLRQQEGRVPTMESTVVGISMFYLLIRLTLQPYWMAIQFLRTYLCSEKETFLPLLLN